MSFDKKDRYDALISGVGGEVTEADGLIFTSLIIKKNPFSATIGVSRCGIERSARYLLVLGLS